MLDFGRDICGSLATAERREWLVTNGIGGYAAGTVAGLLTRRYHGLLIAALSPPLGRTLLLARLDETIRNAGQTCALSINRWASGALDPHGYLYLERFHLEGATPVWTYACADALLEKRVWMQYGVNATYVRYDLRRAAAPLSLSLKALVNYRDHHAATRADTWRMSVLPVTHGLYVCAYDGAVPFYLLCPGARVTPQYQWYRDYYLGVEADRGLDALDDHLYVGLFEATLQPGESLTFVCSTEPTPSLDGAAAYAVRQDYERDLLSRAAEQLGTLPASVEQLALAADQFVVRRPLPDNPGGRTVIAGYPWFGDWGRDTMIALPGLALSTGRPEIARQILLTFSHFVDRGMLPNRFPDAGERPEYNTVDATLWYFNALRAYLAATGDLDLVRGLYPVLQEIVTWHRQGTRYGICLDLSDGLLRAGDPGVQLTWMDAMVGSWVVTPRTGKPVEINALWYNALRVMAEFAERLGEPPDAYAALADRAAAGFARFWNPGLGYCCDVLDGPGGDDPSLRPNQLFAVSLPYSPLTPDQQHSVVDACAQRLLTSHGLRSLAPDHPDYIGHYGGPVRQRDGAYHQGTVWAWLIGPFVDAHLRVYRDPVVARSFLEPLFRHLADGCVGSVSEIFDGDPPFIPRGCFAQAWSVAELLRVWQATKDEGRLTNDE
jgi:predicted glycogen debranching enzyme